MEIEAITEYLHRHIPLTRAMEVRALSAGDEGIALAAPLAPNVNHTDTAFGGSLATLGIVAGWTLLHTTMVDRGVSVRLLIQHSATDFIRPADGDLRVECRFPDGEALPRLLAALRERRRGRIELTAKVYSGGAHVANHQGTYVAIAY